MPPPPAHKKRRMSIRSFYSIDEMTASLENSGTGDSRKDSTIDGNVQTISLNGGYDNEGYNKSGDGLDGPFKPPISADGTSTGKFKLSTKEKWRILKNISAISCAFMIQFTAFQGIANLQSSINAKDGLGTVSLSAIYAALVVSCIFVPTFVIKRLTVKWTLCLSMLCYAPYIGAQFYPKFYTLVPTGVLLGIGAAPMWASKATYLTHVAGIYAKITTQTVDAIVVRFFGFFFLAWQTAELWGNLISSLVLSNPHGAHGGPELDPNDTSAFDTCGANFCIMNMNVNDKLARPDDKEIYEISTIYICCIIVAVIIIALFVDPLSRYGEQSSNELSGIELLTATVRQLKKPNQQLLIPITVWIGMEQAFIGADFTQAYVSCALGIPSVGYVMICFGVVNALCSLLFGSIMKYIGRQVIMALGAVTHCSLIVWFLLWKPHPSNPMLFFIASGLWGVGDAVWQTQVNGFYGTLFRKNKEPAFSNYRLWESSGFVIAYAYSTHLCARMKLYVMLAVLILGVILYIVVEILRAKRKRRMKEEEKMMAAKGEKSEETDDEVDDMDNKIEITNC